MFKKIISSSIKKKYNLQITSTHFKYAVKYSNIDFLKLYIDIVKEYLKQSIIINYNNVSSDTLFLLSSIYVNSKMLYSIARYNDYTLFDYVLKKYNQQFNLNELVKWNLLFSLIDINEKIMCLLKNKYDFDVMDRNTTLIEYNFFEC